MAEQTHCPHCGKILAQTIHTTKHMAPVVNVKNPPKPVEEKPKAKPAKPADKSSEK